MGRDQDRYNMKKKCGRCKIKKDIIKFNKKTINKNGLSPYCKKCNKIYLKKHYKRNKKYYILKAKKYKKATKKFIDSLKTKCCNCKENHIACLEFHHRDRKTKELNISYAVCVRGFSIKRIKKELKKCDVICSNCHRKLHYNEKLKEYEIV